MLSHLKMNLLCVSQNELSSINSMLGSLSQIVGKNCQLISLQMAIKGRSKQWEAPSLQSIPFVAAVLWKLSGDSWRNVKVMADFDSNGLLQWQGQGQEKGGQVTNLAAASMSVIWDINVFYLSVYVCDMRYQCLWYVCACLWYEISMEQWRENLWLLKCRE